MSREQLTPAQRRVALAIQAVLGHAYHVEWIGRSAGGDAQILLVQHIDSRRALALLFDDVQRCESARFDDYVGTVAPADRRAMELVLAATTDPARARAMVSDENEPHGATGSHAIIDAAVAALSRAVDDAPESGGNG